MRTPIRASSPVVSLMALALAAVPVQAQTDVLTNADVVRMVAGGLTGRVIIALIEAVEEVDFDLSEQGTNELLAAGVSDDVLIALLNRLRPAPPAAAPDPPMEATAFAGTGDAPLVTPDQTGGEERVAERTTGGIPRASFRLSGYPAAEGAGAFGGEVYIWRNFAVGAAFESHHSTGPTVAGRALRDVYGYDSQSLDLRVLATFRLRGGSLSVFGGPSIFPDFEVYEVDPRYFVGYYDGTRTTVGGHFGLDYAYYFGRHFGVGVGMRMRMHAATVSANGYSHLISTGNVLFGVRVRLGRAR